MADLRANSIADYANTGPVSLEYGATFPAGQGLDFSASEGSGATSSIFDDYEVGTFTPTSSNITYSSATGRYVKIGKEVFCGLSLTFPATADTNTADVNNLPYPIGPALSDRGGISMGFTTNTAFFSLLGTASSAIALFRSPSGGSLTNANLSGTVSYFRFSYTIA